MRIALACLLGLAGRSALAADDAVGTDFFEKKIRPVLVEHCYECHSADAKDVKGGLRLDTREAMRRGGESGEALAPGDVEASLLIGSLKYESFEMPPTGKLPDEVIADFETWIAMGAPDPREGAGEVREQEEPRPAAAEALWSLQPVASPEPPAVANEDWPITDVDRFVLARLEAEGTRPAPDADRLTLLRRVYFDLIGLPPTPAQIDAFLADESPEALAHVVDELLASPRFGERWGRHWLDVARFAESNGKSRDVLMPQAWRYRDYVIDAFNADTPWPRFVAEQLAGDLLPAESPEERDRLRVATGFLAVGSKPISGGNLRMDVVDDQIDVTTRAFLGVTVACARCHDHEFDPIPTVDYYALAGIFLSTETLYGGGLKRAEDPLGKSKDLLVLGEHADAALAQLKDRQQRIGKLAKQRDAAKNRVQQLVKKVQAAKKAPKDEKPAKADAAQDEANSEKNEDAPDPAAALKSAQDELAELEQRLKAARAEPTPELEFAIGVREANEVQDCRMHVRGEKNQLGDPAPRGFLSAVSVGDSPAIPKNASGRRQLAEWIGRPDNPLTARVAVNRVWLHLTGRGIVDTVDNFGRSGEEPSHPELLDHLATRFVENGWSTKAIIREIVLSRVYRQSSTFNADHDRRDPANTLYWRASRRRLEGEAIRDAMLAASGRLKNERPEASPVAEIGDGEVGRNLNTKPLEKPYPYRSVYLPIIRGIQPEFLQTFDLPDPSNLQGQRATTNVPAQSLFLMNNPFVVEQAEAFADRLAEFDGEDVDRVTRAFRLCFTRPPTDDEVETSLAFLDRHERRFSEYEKNRDSARRAAWTSFCQALFSSAEFRFVN